MLKSLKQDKLFNSKKKSACAFLILFVKQTQDNALKVDLRNMKQVISRIANRRNGLYEQ